MDVLSAEFAEQVYQTLQTIKSDKNLKSKFLKSPADVLATFDIDLKDYQITVEDHPNYGLYFAILHDDIVHADADAATGSSEHTTFSEYHFGDCHNL